ncbi:DUF6452 family protein [Flavobacterium paronense]|uniref:DUF6452 family protein n=1 Tax=Flavobacterium paronense TaxID=1392775 RepID=A0ABV5GIA5_9FLAO|nr:DUF6452 family protein [Flavobacterium paronense]MDN3677219.1 DUF6452 family protein [Flavobacterium paronense]
MKKIVALLLIVLFSLSGCEKDDICTDETTPRLILEFYDISNPANLKNVVNLKIKGVGQTLDLGTFTSVSKVELPLKIDELTTKYSLILNSTGLIPNEDFLQFNYTSQNIFVSRACGYKTIFELNAFPNGVIKTDGGIPPEDFWIKDINILTTSITTENETHIKILF